MAGYFRFRFCDYIMVVATTTKYRKSWPVAVPVPGIRIRDCSSCAG